MDTRLMQVLYHTVQNYNILPITSFCNVRCLFCSHRQNPPGVKAINVPPLAMDIIKDLITYLDENRKIVIGESASLIMEGEPFTHPYFFESLELLRKRFPQTLIQITTNGSYLNEETINILKKFEPIELNLSLNIYDVNLRQKLMNDKKAMIAYKAPELLKKWDIKYHGSIVAMPHITGWSVLYDTIKTLSCNNALTIRVFKPGFTKFAPSHLQIDKKMLEHLEEKIIKWRKDFCPITLEPPYLSDLKAEIIGVIKGSSAFRAGLRSGDIITAINGQKPFSRVEAFLTLQENGKYMLEIERDKQVIVLNIDITNNKSGLVFDYDISKSKVEQIKSILTKLKPLRPLLLASQLGYHLLKTSLAKINNLHIVPVKNNYFGGNIQCAGLLTIEDFKESYQNYVRENPAPDLILVPSLAFDMGERDLTGAGFWKLEQFVKSPVVML
ncbi:MAG: hypothetical protein PWQ67_1251 [Clostridia bacterium]|nr:hypothetical protein [Clostridia bacterium]